MGWTFYHCDNPNKIEEVRRLYTWQENDRGAEVLDIAAHGNTVYVAVHYWSPDEDNIHASIVLTAQNNRDWCNFGYKAMSENAHPFSYDCPKRILDLLSPTDNNSALEWRRECEETRRRKTALDRLKDGQRIISGGKILEKYTQHQSKGSKTYWLIVKDGKITFTYCRKSWIIDHDWEVIK